MAGTTPSWDDFYSADYNLGVHAQNIADHVEVFVEIATSHPRRVLEVGIGNGGMTLFVASFGIAAVGADNDAGVLERARTRARSVPSVEYVEADAFALSKRFDAGSFDVAFSQGFFEHFDDASIRTLALEQLKVAHRVVFSVPSDQYPRQDFGNERLLSPTTWEAILEPVCAARARYYGLHLFGLRGSIERKLRGELTQPQHHVLVTIESKG